MFNPNPAPGPTGRNPKLPAWQVERERRLHRQFLRVKAAEAKGQSLRAAFKQFAWYWRGETYRSDPTRRVAFSRQTLCRLFRVWRRGGEVPAALRLNYRGLDSAVPAPLAIRFADFVARLQFPSMKAAWQSFSARNGWMHGRRGAKPLRLTYQQIRHALPVARFVQLQKELRTMDEAQQRLSAARFEIVADLRARLQERPRRYRRTGAALSLEASAL